MTIAQKIKFNSTTKDEVLEECKNKCFEYTIEGDCKTYIFSDNSKIEIECIFNKIELRVIEMINCMTGGNWFVVNELECGSEVGCGESFDEANQIMRGLIKDNPSLYFTLQNNKFFDC